MFILPKLGACRLIDLELIDVHFPDRSRFRHIETITFLVRIVLFNPVNYFYFWKIDI